MSAAPISPYPPIVSRFGYSPLGPALWRPDPLTGLHFRDLSLGQASDNAFLGHHYRTGGLALRTEHIVGVQTAFAFLFVIAGRVALVESGGETTILHAFDTATRQGPGQPVMLEFSHDAELVVMKAGTSGADLFGTGSGSWTISRETEEAYRQGEGPRYYFRYRDLGVANATGRRNHIHIVRSTQAMEGGTGWHHHSMGQLFYVLRGWADLLVERQPAVRMTSGDAMCLAPRMKHNVPGFSADYLVLEMCVPADYDTIDAPAP